MSDARARLQALLSKFPTDGSVDRAIVAIADLEAAVKQSQEFEKALREMVSIAERTCQSDSAPRGYALLRVYNVGRRALGEDPAVFKEPA